MTEETLTLTAEQTLELERVRSENAQAKAKLAELDAKTQEAADKQAASQRREAERDALLACGVTFYNGPEALEFMKSDPASDVRFDPATKEATAVVGKERVPLSDALRQFALDHPVLADGRSLRHLKSAERPIKPRSEWTNAEKIEYLNHHSAEEYAAIPAHPVQSTVEIRTLAEWSRLPIATKTRIVAEKGSDFIGRLPRK